MAKNVVNARAANARARMARRAKRARFWKENKKRLTMIFVGFLVIVFLVFFTPWGPGYYRMKIEERKMETSRNVAPGVIHDLYSLGVFYQYTMRKGLALDCYDEIGRLYFGHALQEFARSPDGAFEKRRQAEIRIKRGQFQGPPFVVPENEIKYVTLAIWRVGDIIQFDRSKQFTYNLFRKLYLDEMYEKYQAEMEPEVTALVQAYCDRFIGAR